MDRYTAVEEAIRDLVPDLDPSRLVQVDVTKPSPGLALGRRVVDDLDRAVALLHRIAARPSDPMQEFRSAFDTRYGSAEVGLAQVLDEETGIGYHSTEHPAAEESPLLANLELGLAPEPAQHLGQTRRRAAGPAHPSPDHRRPAVELTSADVDALTEPDPLPLPDALSVMATLLGDRVGRC